MKGAEMDSAPCSLRFAELCRQFATTPPRAAQMRVARIESAHSGAKKGDVFIQQKSAV